MIAADLYANVRVLKFQQGHLEVALLPGLMTGDLTTALPRKLQQWTGQRWMISINPKGTAPTLAERDKARKAEMIEKAYDDPALRAVRTYMPDSTITDIITEK